MTTLCRTPSSLLNDFKKDIDLAGITGLHYENLMEFGKNTLPPSIAAIRIALDVCVRLSPRCVGLEPSSWIELKIFCGSTAIPNLLKIKTGLSLPNYTKPTKSPVFVALRELPKIIPVCLENYSSGQVSELRRFDDPNQSTLNVCSLDKLHRSRISGHPLAGADAAIASAIADLFLSVCRMAIDNSNLEVSHYQKDVRSLLQSLQWWYDAGQFRECNPTATAISHSVIDVTIKKLANLEKQGDLTKSNHEKGKRALEILLHFCPNPSPDWADFNRRLIGSARGPSKQKTKAKETDKSSSVSTTPTPYKTKSLVSTIKSTPRTTQKRFPSDVPFSLGTNFSLPQTSPTSDQIPTLPANTTHIEVSTSSAPIKTKAPKNRHKTISPDAFARNNTISQIDPNRVEMTTLVRFFSFLQQEESDTLIYAWLCVTTGINWKLLVSMNKSDTHHSMDLDELLLKVQYGSLEYIVRNGAHTFPEQLATDSNQLLCLSLPNNIIAQLTTTASSRPLEEMQHRLQDAARRFSEIYPGISPTPERLNASFFSIFSPLGLEEIEASYVSGRIALHQRAQAQYIRLTLSQLNINYQETYKRFANAFLAKTSELNLSCLPFLNNIDFPNAHIKGYVGSQVALRPEDLKVFFRKLKKLFSDSNKVLSKTSSDETLSQWIKTLQIQHIYFFVLSQLFLGMRPTGDKTEIALSENFGALVRDKASASYEEITYSPTNEILLLQFHACQKSLYAFLAWSTNHNVKIESASTFDQECLPLHFSEINGKLIVDRMRGQDFEHLLVQYELANDLPRKINQPNVFRHTVSTYLFSERKIPTSVLDEFAGHQSAGREIFSPWSTASTRSFTPLVEALDQLKIILGLGVFKTKAQAPTSNSN